MFPRRALAMVILTILKDHPEGLTGYSIREAMKEKFPEMMVPSAGTIYPRLKRLNRKGDIEEKNNLYLISAQGKDKLVRKIPEFINESMDFYPMFYKFLMRTLTFKSRMDYMSRDPPFFGHGPHKHMFDESIFPEDFNCTADTSESVTRLQAIKTRLLKVKTRIQERLEGELQAIDEKIRMIDEKIQQCEEDKASRVKISVTDGDVEDR